MAMIPKTAIKLRQIYKCHWYDYFQGRFGRLSFPELVKEWTVYPKKLHLGRVQLPLNLVRSEKDMLSNESLICENVLFLGSLPVISSGDDAELQATLRQIVKDYETSLLESTPRPKIPFCLSFPINNDSTVFNQQSGEVLQSFDAKKIAFYYSTWIKDTQGYIVFTYPGENPNFEPAAFKMNYHCFVYQCSSMFEVSYVAISIKHDIGFGCNSSSI
ncbi:hypothetical protein TSMEX_007265 [Taenia solium]|eukprot:TsM_001087400 transcript=TsM_001087400 gene=TsM_001087400